MAEYKTTVALEVGAQSVTMGVFTPRGKGFTLSRYARRDIVLDPLEEGMRIDYVSSAVTELVEELKVKGSDVRSVVSGQQVFMRFIKLLVLDTDDIDELVGFEAQQQIPFPLDEIAYSYQQLGMTEEGEREVLLVAIKKEVLDELHEQVQAGGLKVRGVDCSVTSLYNVYRACYPDDGECTMILDIGAKTTDIIFSEGERFFTRSVTAAGGFVTSAIAREQKVSFREAEELKVSMGAVSMGNGHTDSMEPQQAALATTIRNAMNRLGTEVQRTINHYRSQLKGTAPSKVLICGGGSRLPFTLEFLQETLSLPIDYLRPLEAFSLGSHVDPEAVEMDAVCLGPIAGAAVTGAGVGEFSIDLVPTSVQKDRDERALLPKVALAGGIALAGAAFFTYAAMDAADTTANYLKTAEAKYQSDDSMNSRIATAEGRYTKLEKDLADLLELKQARTAYIDILKMVIDKTPSTKYWFTEFSPMINYDIENLDLTGPTQNIQGVKLIDMTRSINGTSVTAINEPGEVLNSKMKNKAPMVNAIYLSGYVIKTPGSKDIAHQDIIRDIVSQNFDNRTAGTLFDLDAQKVNSNLNKYFRFISSKDLGKEKELDYVEKFMIVMPLKEPIAYPVKQEKK